MSLPYLSWLSAGHSHWQILSTAQYMCLQHTNCPGLDGGRSRGNAHHPLPAVPSWPGHRPTSGEGRVIRMWVQAAREVLKGFLRGHPTLQTGEGSPPPYLRLPRSVITHPWAHLKNPVMLNDQNTQGPCVQFALGDRQIMEGWF